MLHSSQRIFHLFCGQELHENPVLQSKKALGTTLQWLFYPFYSLPLQKISISFSFFDRGTR